MSGPGMHYDLSLEGMGPPLLPAEGWFTSRGYGATAVDLHLAQPRHSSPTELFAWGLDDSTWSPSLSPCLSPVTPTWALPAPPQPTHAQEKFTTRQPASIYPYLPHASPASEGGTGQVAAAEHLSTAFPNAEAMQTSTTAPSLRKEPATASTSPIRCFDHGCGGRRFYSKGNYVRHLREKNGLAKRFSCRKCGGVFTRSTARDKHIRDCQGSR